MGDGMHPGGGRTLLVTGEPKVSVALGTDKFLVGDTHFMRAGKGQVHSVPLPLDTTLPYEWPGDVQYAKFDLTPAIVKEKLVWALNITCD